MDLKLLVFKCILVSSVKRMKCETCFAQIENVSITSDVGYKNVTVKVCAIVEVQNCKI